MNEQHEPARGEKSGGGGVAQFVPIDWTIKAQRLNYTLQAAVKKIQRSPDPSRDSRYYLVALPDMQVQKTTTQLKKYPTGVLTEPTNYGGEHSLVFRRLGLDLIDVVSEGQAIVHATRDRLERLIASTTSLASEGLKQQARFRTIESFEAIPSHLRVDKSWLATLPNTGLIDTIVEFQPLLTRVEFDNVQQAITALLAAKGEGVARMGVDFSGRHWLRGQLRRTTIEAIAKDFYSVQSIHPPLFCELGALKKLTVSKTARVKVTSAPPPPIPTVAVVDSGVSPDHPRLAAYRRGVGYVDPDAGDRWLGDHGSLVASRIVFGDLDSAGEALGQPGRCSFYDVMVALDQDGRINHKGILDALNAVVATAPDIRVFNLSFGDKLPLNKLSEVERREWLILTQDLDNFIFARDVLVVIAAGNSRANLVPSKVYPEHIDEPDWALAALPSGFNTLTCGSAVERYDEEGLVQEYGWPSPFTRIGPAFPSECDAPIPEFGAHGGNANELYARPTSLGVYGLNAAGLLEDHSGTSFAAPLLSREAAFAFVELQKACAPATQVYAATVKAYLALVADAYPTNTKVRKLSERTLGHGKASAHRLINAAAHSAVFIWQGLIQEPKEIVRIELPIPREWLLTATTPKLRVACGWDTPVNAAIRGIWGCRRVDVKLRPSTDNKALSGSRAKNPIHPLWVRSFDLSKENLVKHEISAVPHSWILELDYSQVADYNMDFSPQQRVGLALEILDEAESAESPQAAVQALPIFPTMLRLSQSAVTIATPVKIRGR